MHQVYGKKYENHKVVDFEQYKKEHKSANKNANQSEAVDDMEEEAFRIRKENGYLYGIVSFFGYTVTLLVYIICHLDITMKEQLLTLLAWLAIDFIISYICRMVQRLGNSFPLNRNGKSPAKAMDRRASKRKPQFYRRIGA